MTYLQVCNWHKFQHYKDRSPPWIKLYSWILNKYEFTNLSDQAKAHLMLIWSLASQINNKIPNDPKWIAQQISAKRPVNLEQLASAGFLEPYQPASEALAECKQDASKMQAPRARSQEAEAEAEERRGRGEETADARAPNGRPPPPPASPRDPEGRQKVEALYWLNGQAEDVRSEFDDYYRNDHPEQEPKWKAVAPFRQRLASERKQAEADAQPHRCPYGICDGTRFIQRTVAEYVRTVRNDAGESCEATVPEHTTASPCKCHAAYGKGIS